MDKKINNEKIILNTMNNFIKLKKKIYQII